MSSKVKHEGDSTARTVDIFGSHTESKSGLERMHFWVDAYWLLV